MKLKVNNIKWNDYTIKQLGKLLPQNPEPKLTDMVKSVAKVLTEQDLKVEVYKDKIIIVPTDLKRKRNIEGYGTDFYFTLYKKESEIEDLDIYVWMQEVLYNIDRIKQNRCICCGDQYDKVRLKPVANLTYNQNAFIHNYMVTPTCFACINCLASSPDFVVDERDNIIYQGNTDDLSKSVGNVYFKAIY